MCALATNHGVVLVDKQGSLFPVVADVAAADTKKHKHKHKMQGDTSPREMFDVDWGHPDLLLAGGRAAKIWTMDLRAPERQWSSIRHVSSVAKLRAVGAHQVVACGPRNAMALYDVRYTTARQHSQSMSDGPLLTFPEYKNEAQLHVGFDVWPEAVGGVPPVVAAAHDDGTVGVYSLSSGRKLPCRALDAAAAAGGRRQINAGTGAAAAVEPRPVRALRFADFPVDGSPSLWVGQGMDVVKYTLGRGDDEE